MILRLDNKISKFFHILGVIILALYSGNAYAQEITAIDFNGDLIGKVIPDGKVVSFENQLIGNITADSLIVDFDGKLIGGVVPRGIAIGNDNRLLGKVNNDGTVRLSTGKIIGKVLPNGLVVDDKFDILGAVLFPGLIYSDSGETLGRLTGDGMYANLQGQNIGFISPDGYAYRRVGNDYVLEGRLISSKMVVDAVGHFVGSVSPGGKITDFDGRQIGFIKANGFAYDAENKIIGRIVNSGYAFDNTGKYIGLVTFNGEVMNNDKLVGYLQVDGSIADTGGNNIGFMVDIAATVNDSTGRYLGRVMPEGKIARGRNTIGQIGPLGVVYDRDGKQIGREIASGPVFDYRGDLRAHALRNGQVILPNGTPLGTTRGTFAINASGKVVGSVLQSRLVVTANNQSLGITGINSAMETEGDRRIVSPFGYVYNPEGGIDGNAILLGGVYGLGGKTLGSISPNGEIIYNGAVQNGRITQYGYDISDSNAILGGKVSSAYAVDSRGNNLGILADGNQLLNKGLKQIAKILPDNSVVSSYKNVTSYTPVIGKALDARVAVSYDGGVLGLIDDQGLVRDEGAAIIGKVTSDGIVLDNNNNSIGETVSFQPIINDKCEFMGVITPSGEIKNYREVSVGKILANRQVISESGNVIGFAVPSSTVSNIGGTVIGTVSAGGKVLNYAAESLGCIDKRGRLYNQQKELIGSATEAVPVMDFAGKIIGRSLINGSVVDNNSENIGHVLPDSSVNSTTGTVLGTLFKYRYAFNNQNKLIGIINDKGEVINPKGSVEGKVDFEGNVISGKQNIGYALYDMYMYNNAYQAIGYIAPDGNIISFSNQRLGNMIRGFAVDNSGKMFARGNRDFLIRNKQNAIIGELYLDGKVINSKGEHIGSLGAAGDIEAIDGQVIATAKPLQYYDFEQKRAVYDASGNVIGYVGPDSNKILDSKGNVIGQVTQDGSAIGLDGTVIGNTRLDWYEHPIANPHKLPEVGSIKVPEKGEYRRSVNIALTPDGEYLGDILEDGSVINKDGTVIGKLLPDGLVVDKEGSLIGIEESAKSKGKDEIFVPAGAYGPGAAYGTGTGPGALGPGGGYGPGERYDPQRSYALEAAQQERRQGMAVGHVSSEYSREDFDGKQKDWGIRKIVSTLPVDMDMMILADKPIPAVIARSIDTEHEVPVTAFVERNVYAEDGRNVIIPAGSRLIGSCGGSSAGEEVASSSARITIQWERLIMPNGVMFDMTSAQTGDAQGRGGVLGYLDRQLIKKYGMPFLTNLANSGLALMFASNEKNGQGAQVETSKQQAASDARENFLENTQEMFNQILQDRAGIRAITFIPAGTRIIVYPKVDLWLRTADNAGEGKVNEYEDTLINDEAVEREKAQQRNNKRNRSRSSSSSSSSSSVVYEEGGEDTQPASLVDDSAMEAQRNRRKNKGATPPPPPRSGVVNNPQQPSAGSSSTPADTTSDVPQLF